MSKQITTANCAETVEKTCKITNKPFCWLLQVDGMEIPLQGSFNASYFYNHYKALGYSMEGCDDYIVLEAGGGQTAYGTLKEGDINNGDSIDE